MKLEQYAIAALRDTPWIYDHSGEQAFVRVASPKPSSHIDAPLELLVGRSSHRIVTTIAEGLNSLGFTVGEIEFSDKYRFAGISFVRALPVSIKGRKPVPWLIEPLVAAIILEDACAAGPLYTHYKKLALGSTGLKSMLDEMAYDIVGALRKVIDSEVNLANARVQALEQTIELLRQEYDELYALWDSTDNARRHLALQINSQHTQED
jgi:hypothetical protein